MDPQVSSSFIPKKPLGGGGRHHGMFGVLMLVCLLIFVTSLVAAGATFLYGQYLNSALASKSKSLTLSQEAFSSGVIEDLVRLDSRINQSKALLAKHVALSALFTFLSDQTLEAVQFTKFEYSLGENGVATMRLDGIADNFSTIALQSDQFGASKVLKDVVFSSIVISPDNGQVTFSVSANMDPSLTLYSRGITQTTTQP